MKFTVATNWDPELIEKIDYPEVESVFGGLGNAIVGSGRPAVVIKNVSESNVKSYIKRVHDKGWEFNLTVNAICTGNSEFKADGYKNIVEYFDYINSLNVDSVTLAMPSLINIVRKHFPRLKIKISTYQRVSNVAMAKRFEEMGVEEIMISEHCNRDFNLLRAIRKNVKCKIILLANPGCVYYCPNVHTHPASGSHSSSKDGSGTIFNLVPFISDCMRIRLENPTELIKTRYIRPEDLYYYEEIGIDTIKIIDRNAKTDLIAERVKAYHDRSYDGNLLKFVGQMYDKNLINMNMDEVIRLSGMNPINIAKIQQTMSKAIVPITEIINVDNKKFPSEFIKGYENKNCANNCCETCGYCEGVASKVIQILDKNEVEDSIKRLKSVREEIINGSVLY